MLDSIANLSIAAPQHEVIAVALSMSGSDVKLFMAGNHEVPPSTVIQVPKLWSLLQALSKDYGKHHKLPNRSKSRPQPRTSSLPSAAQNLVMRFRRESLKFCSGKLNHRITKHYKSLLATDCPQFSSMQWSLKDLAELISARDIVSDKRWDLVCDELSNLQMLTTQIVSV